MKILFILLAIVFVFCSAAYCDLIFLVDGTEIEGEIVGIDADNVTIRTEQDTFTVSKYRIKKVEKDEDEDKKIEKERIPVGPGGPKWDLHWDQGTGGHL
ncbi:MAG: hypothetical protein KKD29_07590 [Candidatus Omnitrophica bacterium]|nr:hypothetical protein [Candidatus Omnitrophota bacterium]MBU4488842.1 hypothetical protein [Candidatus Omnitrophota bacterium]MCG2705205.1 hypothetical protein [Candidatus Omnitrophota bacterium]